MYASTLSQQFINAKHMQILQHSQKNKSKYRVRERDNEHRIFNVENLRRDQKPRAYHRLKTPL